MNRQESYNAAADAARDGSAAAKTSGKRADHLGAVDLHKVAAGKARECGAEDKACEHDKWSRDHELEAEKCEARGNGATGLQARASARMASNRALQAKAVSGGFALNDLQQQLQEQLSKLTGGGVTPYPSISTQGYWLADIKFPEHEDGEEWEAILFGPDGKLYECAFTLDGKTISLEGDPKPVVKATGYEYLDEEAAEARRMAQAGLKAANEAGVNQHTKGTATEHSQKADLASKKADGASLAIAGQDDKDGHCNASDLHEAARQAHILAANEQMKDKDVEAQADHANAASYHERMAEMHRRNGGKSALTLATDARSWTAVATGAQAAIEAGDFPGHAFHGNQYSGADGSGEHNEASRAAHESSRGAAKSGNAGDHKKAAAAHRKAARMQDEEGNDDAASYHRSMAKFHSDKAEKIAFDKAGEGVKVAASSGKSSQALECRSIAGEDLRSTIPCLDDGVIMYMPGGQHVITPSQGGKAVRVCVNVTASTADTLEQQRRALSANGKTPFFSVLHDSEIAAFWPKEFFWDTRKDATGQVKAGVWAKGDWSAAGREAVEGKNIRTFSPTFFVDAVRCDESDPAEVVCNEQARANMGALENDPAFQKMSPLWSRGEMLVVDDDVSAADTADENMKQIEAGDYVGHVFHGNQFIDAESASKAEGGNGERHKASKAAHDASRAAKTTAEHRKAAQLHMKAAKLHEESDHDDTAAYHEAIAQDHLHAAGATQRDKDYLENKYGKNSLSSADAGGNAGAIAGINDGYGENIDMRNQETVAELQARNKQLERKIAELALKDDLVSKAQLQAAQSERREIEAACELAEERDRRKALEAADKGRKTNEAARAVGRMVNAGKIGVRDRELQAQYNAKFISDPTLIPLLAGDDTGDLGRITGGATAQGLQAGGNIDPYESCSTVTGGFDVKKAFRTYYGLVARNAGVKVGKFLASSQDRSERYKEKGAIALDCANFYRRELAPRIKDWETIPIQQLAMMAGAVRQDNDGSLRAADTNQGTTDTAGNPLDPSNTTGTLAGTLVLQRTLPLFKYNYPHLGMLFSDFSDSPGLYEQTEVTRIVSQPATERYDSTTDGTGRPKGWSTVSPAVTTDAPIKLSDYISVPIVFGQEVLSATSRKLFDEQSVLAIASIADYFTKMITTLATAANFNSYATANGTTVKVPHPTYVKSNQEFSMADLDNIGAAFTDNKVPVGDRGVFLNAQYYAKLRGDMRLLLQFAAQGGKSVGDVSEFISEAKIPRLSGFTPIESPFFPTTANGVGFAFHKAGIMLKSRLPQDFTKALNVMVPGSVTTVTDPDTGISLMLVQYVHLTQGYAEWRPEVILGAAVGDARGGMLITSA